MFVNRWYGDFKQHTDKLLRQPDGFILNAHFNAVFPGLLGKDQKFGGTVSDAEAFFLLIGSLNLTVNHVYAFFHITGSCCFQAKYRIDRADNATYLRIGIVTGYYLPSQRL